MTAPVRFGPDDRVWVVVDPTADSKVGDVVYETTLVGLERQFRGGLSMDRRPTLFANEADARREAVGRLVAARAARAIRAYVAQGGDLSGAGSVSIADGEGRPLFESEL